MPWQLRRFLALAVVLTWWAMNSGLLLYALYCWVFVSLLTGFLLWLAAVAGIIGLCWCVYPLACFGSERWDERKPWWLMGRAKPFDPASLSLPYEVVRARFTSEGGFSQN